MTIDQFAKLDFLRKMLLIEHEGILLDTYIDKNDIIKIYFLHEFFIEVNVNVDSRFITDIIPFKRGFKLTNDCVSHCLSA